jgi:PPOX class probable FMN-dependent enzyme
MDGNTIDSLAGLREVYSEPSERAAAKQLSSLDEHCRKFLSLSPFVVLGTEGDVSPKGDHPGFVTVLDDNKILIPDRGGNNRLDSLQNLLANPRIGLLFFIPGVNETLRINGTAEITGDAELLEPMAVNNKVPKTGIIVHVEEAYLHCAKALMRSNLWSADTGPDRSGLPGMGQMLAEQTGIADGSSGTKYQQSIEKAMAEEGRD